MQSNGDCDVIKALMVADNLVTDAYPMVADTGVLLLLADRNRTPRQRLYGELWRRLGRFERALPSDELKAEFDSELWELARRFAKGEGDSENER